VRAAQQVHERFEEIMSNVVVYGIPSCTTVRKARA
jgi:hypothetical protein